MIDGFHVTFKVLEITFLQTYTITHIKWNRDAHFFSALGFRILRFHDAANFVGVHRRGLASGTGEVADA